MQFRAGIVYVLLFVVVAAGAYGVIASASAPQVAIDEGDADYVLGEGDSFEVGGESFDVTSVSGDSASVEQVNESAILEVEWEGADLAGDDEWDDGDTVALGEEDPHLLLMNPPEGEDEEYTSFTLVEEFDEEEHEPITREDWLYFVEGESEELVPVEEYDAVETQTFELGDEIEFYDEEAEETIAATITEVSADGVVLEYEGEAVTEYTAESGETLTLAEEDLGAYVTDGGDLYLTNDAASLEAQQAAVTTHEDRVRGLWWVVVMAGFTAVTVAALAFMPVRG